MSQQNDFDDRGKFAKGNQQHTRRVNHGRPCKLSRFAEEFKNVVETPHRVGYAIIYTDEELLRLTNRRLDEKDRVGYASFDRYKKGELQRDYPELEEFQELYMDALQRQKEALFDAMTGDGEERSWQRWAWIIERKFDSWNLRQKQVDETPDPKQLVFRVDDGGDEAGE